MKLILQAGATSAHFIGIDSTQVKQKKKKTTTQIRLTLYFTIFVGVKGEVLGPSFDSKSHVSEWLSMRPWVLCDDNVLTFMASREGFEHLLVERGTTKEISYESSTAFS